MLIGVSGWVGDCRHARAGMPGVIRVGLHPAKEVFHRASAGFLSGYVGSGLCVRFWSVL